MPSAMPVPCFIPPTQQLCGGRKGDRRWQVGLLCGGSGGCDNPSSGPDACAAAIAARRDTALAYPDSHATPADPATDPTAVQTNVATEG